MFDRFRRKLHKPDAASPSPSSSSSPAGSSAVASVVITVVVRSGCHLCDVAIPVVEQFATDAGIACEVVDITSRPDAAALSDLVPVFFVNGRQVGYWRADVSVLAAAVADCRRVP